MDKLVFLSDGLELVETTVPLALAVGQAVDAFAEVIELCQSREDELIIVVRVVDVELRGVLAEGEKKVAVYAGCEIHLVARARDRDRVQAWGTRGKGMLENVIEIMLKTINVEKRQRPVAECKTKTKSTQRLKRMAVL